MKRNQSKKDRSRAVAGQEPLAGRAGPGGTAIFSGMEESEAAAFLPELAAAGFAPVAEARDGGWWAVAARS